MVMLRLTNLSGYGCHSCYGYDIQGFSLATDPDISLGNN